VCLSIALDRPADVLDRGEHLGFEWIVVHNGSGYRCGYVRVPGGHPWHGKEWNELEEIIECHGGVTFGAPDRPCDKGGADDAYWVGFDCAHAGDAPDPQLPGYDRRQTIGALLSFVGISSDRYDNDTVRTQEYVEAECRSICEQAQRIASLLPT
jgi:hypothetical protein